MKVYKRYYMLSSDKSVTPIYARKTTAQGRTVYRTDSGFTLPESKVLAFGDLTKEQRDTLPDAADDFHSLYPYTITETEIIHYTDK